MESRAAPCSEQRLVAIAKKTNEEVEGESESNISPDGVFNWWYNVATERKVSSAVLESDTKK